MIGESDPTTARRVDVLNAYGLVDATQDRVFDEIAELAGQICQTPVALVSLLDADRQWFPAAVGTDYREMPLSMAICVHALLSDGFLEIEDTTLDTRTSANPLVMGAPNVRFYAGAVLTSPTGVPYGTLCVLDLKPRRLSDVQRSALVVLSRQVMKELDLRVALKRQEFLQREMDHRVKNSLQSVASYVRIEAGNSASAEAREVLAAVGRRISSVALLHQELYTSSIGENVQLDSYMGKLSSLFAAAAPKTVAVEVEFAAAVATIEQASALAAIANEFATNSFKHAFPDGRDGVVSIVGRSDGQGLVTVTMRDDGVGIAVGATPRGLGMRIIEASAAQMGATLSFGPAGLGFALTLMFPIVRPHASFELTRELGTSVAPANGPPRLKDSVSR